jgi:hypothetical protein
VRFNENTNFLKKPKKQFSRCKDQKEKENRRLCFGEFLTDLFWRISQNVVLKKF